MEKVEVNLPGARWPRRRSPLLVGACALFLLLAACSALQDLEREGTTTRRFAESARLSLVFLPNEGQSLPQQLEGVFEGEIANGGERARLTMDFGAGRGTVEGPELEMIFVKDGPVYMRPLAEPGILPRGKSWMEFEVEYLEQLAPGMQDFARLLVGDRILGTFDFPDEDEIGTATIRGEETVGYTINAESEEVAEVMGLSSEQLAEMERVMGEDLEFSFWLDDEGFARRMEAPVKFPRLAGPEPLTIRLEVFDLNADIEVEVPPASEVAAP